MNYKVVVFGVKDTTEEVIEFIHNECIKVDLVVTVDQIVTNNSNLSGYKNLEESVKKHNIELLCVRDYSLEDQQTREFFLNNSFDIAISVGWQRLIPEYILDRFKYGIFGFHGSSGYLPYGRGRSPLNWSIIKGEERFNFNLFRYDKYADSPNVFDTVMFQINKHDTIRTLQYKTLLASKMMISKLITAYNSGEIVIKTSSKDKNYWYKKRTPEDGKIDFEESTASIYNLIRGVTKPFPGAFAYCNGKKITIWKATPFDNILDFSAYAPGEIVDILFGDVIVRTRDGSIVITEYEGDKDLKRGDCFM